MLRALAISSCIVIAIFLSCKKNGDSVTVPQSIIDQLSSACSSDSCKPKINRVDLDGIDYLGVYFNAPCSNYTPGYYHKSGVAVDYPSTLYYDLSHKGQFKETLWECH